MPKSESFVVQGYTEQWQFASPIVFCMLPEGSKPMPENGPVSEFNLVICKDPRPAERSGLVFAVVPQVTLEPVTVIPVTAVTPVDAPAPALIQSA